MILGSESGAPPWPRLACALFSSLLLLSVATTPARAQQSEEERAAMARALFSDGMEHVRDERFEEAAELFRRAYALRPAPAIAFNLGSALFRSGHLVEAIEVARRVTRDEEAPADLRQASQELIDDVGEQIGSLDLSVSGPTEDVAYRLDGEPLDAAAVGVTVPIDPGSHTVEALRDEEVVASVSFEVPQSGAASPELTIPPPPPEPEPEPVTPAPIVVREPSGGGVDAGLAVGLTIAAVLVVGGAITTAILVVDSQGQEADPIPGTTIPPVLEWE